MDSDPSGDYGYHYQYPIGFGLSGHRILSWVVSNFNWAFPFEGCPNRIKVGDVCDLDHIAPVRVTAIWPKTFQVYSLPGHPEGPDKHINFTFYGNSDRYWYRDDLDVTAWGPNNNFCKSNWVCALGNETFAYVIWQVFADNVAADMPIIAA